MKSYPEREGKRVWLSENEIQQVINEAESTEQRIAVKLAARCGLRRSEIVEITAADLVTSEKDSYHLRVWESVAKKEHYREPPVPDMLATEIETFVELGGIDDGESVIDVHDKTVYRWVKRACVRLEAETGDEGWSRVDAHDLRRSWATHALGQGVLPSVVMSWGGWHDWDTFRKHYLGEFSPEVLERERQKVSYLADGDPIDADSASNSVIPSVNNRHV